MGSIRIDKRGPCVRFLNKPNIDRTLNLTQDLKSTKNKSETRSPSHTGLLRNPLETWKLIVLSTC